MNASTIGIVAILVIIVVFALRGSLKHLKGNGGGALAEPEKKLDGPILGKKTIQIEGMHCENCKNSVERAINRIDGASCQVNLKRNTAVVSYDRELADESLRQAIEWLEFKVTGIRDEECRDSHSAKI